MKIYIAGRLSQRAELHEVRKQLWALGHEVVSTWIDEGHTDYTQDSIRSKKIALRDICQIASADVLILDTTSPLSFDGGGGREFEYAVSLMLFQYKEQWRVGPAKNAFHSLIDQSFATWEECLQWLQKK